MITMIVYLLLIRVGPNTRTANMPTIFTWLLLTPLQKV